MREIILHLNSNPATGHSTNNFTQSQFELYKEINISQRAWFCTVLEFETEADIVEDVYLCCDFVDHSIVNGRPIRALKGLKGTTRGRIYYPIETEIPISVATLQNIKLYISGSLSSHSYRQKNWSVTLKIFKNI